MVSETAFDEQRSDSMRGKICVVTGANAGIGKATALSLAKLGATVTMVCRNADRGQAALADIREASGSSNLELLIADLASQQAVRQLAADYLRSHDKLHVLVNNAGTSSKQRILTEDKQ
jgi:NAD(P)-dependent dehydrogenase (short-subunit alcohol dehydrogenase family)